MRYLVIEHFTNGPDPVYERLAARGRMLPPGLTYLDSWVDADDLGRCFQLMETDDRSLFDRWLANWDDLAECEIVPVISSAAAHSHQAEAAVDREDLARDVAGLVGQEKDGRGRDLPG